MAIVDTFGKCKCGEFNSLNAVSCHGCGSRLPWANMPSGGAKSATGTGRTQANQTNYWSAALSGQSGAVGGATSYNNDPDIDFTPLGSGAVASGGSGLGGAAFYCSYCGTGLKAGQAICHRCRHMTTFTKADLRFTMMISALLVSGFLLGVVWTAVVLNAANTGEWRLPGVQYTKTKVAPVQKPVARISRPSPAAVDEYGVSKR